MTSRAEITDFSPYGRGACTDCGRTFDLTKAGKVRHHLEPKQSGRVFSPRCPGAGQTPASPSPA